MHGMPAKLCCVTLLATIMTATHGVYSIYIRVYHISHFRRAVGVVVTAIPLLTYVKGVWH